jgi:hypothetical protein
MSWQLYKKDDPNTWPELDCPMLIYKEDFNSLHIWRWNNELNKFINDDTERVIHYTRECYYQYIGYVPNGYKAIETSRCMDELRPRCEFEDDGYCMNDVCCKFKQTVNEYVLNDNKRIWKEFE